MDSHVDLVALEILKIARDLVINDYTERRAQEHNVWLVESQRMWQTQRIQLIYPDIPTYPTERDILLKAKVLLDFVYYQTVPAPEEKVVIQTEVKPEEPMLEMNPSPIIDSVKIPEPVVIPKKIEPVVEVPYINLPEPVVPVVPLIQDTIEEPIIDDVVPTDIPAPAGILPSVMKKIEGLLKAKPK